MRRRPWIVRIYGGLLRRGVPSLSPQDLEDAIADVDRLRADAARESWRALAGHWFRELRALTSTIIDERRRARRASDGPSGLGGRLRQHADALIYDVRHACRSLVHDPLATIFVLASVTLGVGANAITLGLVDRLLIQGPAAVHEPGRLVRFYRRVARPPTGEQTSPWLPLVTYRHLRDRLPGVESIGAYGVRDTMVGVGGDTQMMRVGMTQGAFFATLGLTPGHGRYFIADEDASTAGALAILSDRLWQTDFDGDPAAIGRILSVDGVPHTIVGVAPAGFSGPQFDRVDAWTLGDARVADRYNWKVIARLSPDASAASISHHTARIRARSEDDEPKWMDGAALFAAPIRFDDSGHESTRVRIAWWMTGVSVIILVVACANVVNLLLVRLARRQRELGVRIALGSGRSRLFRLIAFEGGLLALAGGTISLWVAGTIGPMVRQALFPEGGDWTSAGVDSRLIVLVSAIVGVTAAAIGIAPAIGADRGRVRAALGSRIDRGAARSRVRAALTVVQTALSVVLLVGAGLFVRSLAAVASIDLGSEPDRVLVVELKLDRPPVPGNRADFPAYLETIALRERIAYRRVVERVRSLAGVERASITIGLPFDNGSFTTTLAVPGADAVRPLPGGGPYISAIGPDYFETIGTRLVRGRGVLRSDGEGTEPIAIVSQTTADRLWPATDPIGLCVRIGGADAPCARVVGIAADAHRVSLAEAPSLQVYVPAGQERGFAGARLIVRPDGRAPIGTAVLRQAIADVDAGTRFIDVRRLDESLGPELRPLRLGLATFGLGALFAVITAALGLYGVMSYAVAWRRREIGIRLALGATRGQIRYLIAGNGVLLAAIGVGAGLGCSLIVGRLLQPQLFETSAADPVVLGGVACLLIAVSVAAGLIPSSRAARVAPSESLRSE